MKFLKKISRRNFFRKITGRTFFAGSVLFGLEKDNSVKNFFVNRIQKEDKLSIKSYRNLGDTGFKVSDIGFGVNTVFSPAVLAYAVDCGVNFIDTGATYANGNAIKTAGEALKGRRDKVWISNKFHGFSKYPDLKSAEFKKWLMDGFEDDLKSLQTDRVDSILMHNVDQKMYDRKDEVFEVFEKAKQQGKVRFLGLSGHHAEFEPIVQKALQTKRFSMIMPRFNFLLDKKKREIYEKASKNGTAILTMKTFTGLFELEKEKWEELNKGEKIVGRNKEFTVAFTQSALKYILSNPYINVAVLSMSSFDHVKAYLPLSGMKMGNSDRRILKEYEKMVYNIYCRIGCNVCHSACPYNVPVNDILRCRMYFENYHFERLGIEEYAGIEPDKRGDKCIDCSAVCMEKCPYGLNIKERVSQTHEMLSIQANYS